MYVNINSPKLTLKFNENDQVQNEIHEAVLEKSKKC